MPHKDAIDCPQLDTPKGGYTREEKLRRAPFDIMDDLREGCRGTGSRISNPCAT